MRIGEMLLKAGVVNDLQLNAAIAEQQRWGGKLGQILVRMGALSEDLLVLALCRQLSLPKAELDAINAVPAVLKERLTRDLCERYHVLPIAYVQERRAVQLAMADPFDVVALDDLTRLLGTKIEAFLAGDQKLAGAIRRLYGAAGAASLQGASDLDFVDNAGRSMSDRTGEFSTVPKSSAQNTAPPAPAAPQAPAPSFSMPPRTPLDPVAQQQLAIRVDEQARAVRAVADLLAERGYIPWIPRR